MMKRSRSRQKARTASNRRAKLSKRLFARSRIAAFEALEDRRLLADYGDAPDLGLGTGFGNYSTLATDNGPSHTIISLLRLGSSVDDDSGTLQNTAANADDVNAALPDDEDGVINPAADLVLTVGTQPTVDVRVTNAALVATLYGWIDYNANGVFENATERTSMSVGSSTFNGIVRLVFPVVPSGFTGTTYARLRLGNDATGANPAGPAGVGEVEDYRVTITRPSDGTADSAKNRKIASGTSGGPALANGDMFGSAVAPLGDLDGDGVEDLAVGAPSQTGAPTGGAVHVLFMNTNGTVKSTQRIGSGIGGGPALTDGDYFGHSVAVLGDLNGDGVTDIAVGADKDDTGGYNRGAVHVLFLNANGTVKSSQKIAHITNNGPALANSDRFGSSITSLGDIDGDGIADLAVGAVGDDTGGGYRGAVHVLFMNANGTVKNSQKIASGVSGGPTLADLDVFGVGVASLGDLDGDGVSELAVSAMFDDTGGLGRGAAYILFLNANGTVKTSQKIASGVPNGPALANGDYFGRSVASLGDLDGDGVTDIAVGAYRDATGGTGRGALHVLLLNANGTVKRSTKIANNTNGGPILPNDSRFGSAVAALGDLDGDGVVDLAVGAETDNTGGIARGAVHVLYLRPGNTPPQFTSPPAANVPENSAFVMTVTAVDVDVPPQTLSFSIAGGADAARFSITSGGTLLFSGTPPNFEVPTDANGDNVYVVTVRVNDSQGSSATQTINVFVTPVNEFGPVITSPNTASVAENTTAVMTVTATDIDLPPQAISFSIVGGADQSRFAITSGGALSFVSPPDFESPTDANGDNVYLVAVQASDGQGGTATQNIFVTVTNVNDNPVFTSPNVAFAPENTTAVMTVTATDAEGVPPTGPITVDAGIPTPGLPGFTTYTVTAAVDAPIVALDFAGDGSNNPVTGRGFFGALNQVNPFGLATIFNDNNSLFPVIGSDAAQDSQFKVTSSAVTVPSGLAEEGPSILQGVWAWSAPQGNSIAFAQLVIPNSVGSVQYRGTVVVFRNGANVELPVASGVLGRPPISFSIVGGADQARLTITPGGALSFVSPPNFEAPSDANGDNIYVVTVRATDSQGGSSTQTISVNVTPVNEHAPVPTSPDAVSVAENTTAVMTVTASDADLPPQGLTFSIVGGADQTRFNISPGGVLSFNAPPDFEAPTDANGDNTYVVIVQASDGTFANLQAILVTVTNASEVPLPGDFNNNGIVDAADHVLWRNGGPLQNDPTPGVQPDDYNIWRANFGRTAGVGSTAEGTSQGSASAIIESESAGSQQHNDLRTLLDVPSLRPDREVVQQRDIRRPKHRGSFAASGPRDDAIAAWLASRWDEPARRFHDIEDFDFVSEFDPSEPIGPSLDELDLAFASVTN